MPSFQDSAVLVLLALLLFGPKQLPVLARQLGKLMADFRRASNEFRSQMEEELRISEQAERQKQVAAIEAAAPPSPAIDAPVSPDPGAGYVQYEPPPAAASTSEPEATHELTPVSPTEGPPEAVPAAADSAPLPIATSGELSIMPPATGLPLSHSEQDNSPATAPAATPQAHESEMETETLHG
jgi:sec-independent protein translocase protein TatB